ncbi:retrovirus-related pol polyprotein from transposon TNT 1-94 [Tanacetum coccineum]
MDTSPRYKNDNKTGQFGNQRAVNVAGARETIGGQVMQQSRIQCFNYKEFGHYAKECRKPKWVKDSTYHKERYTDEEIDEQELEAHYGYMARSQEYSGPKSQANKSVATYRKKTVASESTITNSKSYYRMLYEKTNKAWKWWIEQQCPSGYKWVPKTKKKWVPKVRNENLQKRVSFAIDNASRITNIVQLILFIVDSGCTKHMTGNLSLLCNFVEKYLGTVHFGNDQFAPILGYGDLVQGNIMINRVYYVEGLNHNLFSVGQFCDADLEKQLHQLQSVSWLNIPLTAWLWHRRLSHLNFDSSIAFKESVGLVYPKLICDHAVIVVLAKALLRNTFLGDKLVSGCQRSMIVLQCHQQRLNRWRYFKLCSSLWYEDTASRIMDSYYNKLPLYCDSQPAMQSHATRVITPLTSTTILSIISIKEQVLVSCQENWYELFDSAEMEVLTKDSA